MLINPYGQSLVNRIVSDEELDKLTVEMGPASEIVLNHDDMINAVNIAVGSYSPLTGFMTEEEYLSVTDNDALPSGLDWTMPILLHDESDVSASIKTGDWVYLKTVDGSTVGLINVESIFHIDHRWFEEKIFGTHDPSHPGVSTLSQKKPTCIGGSIHFLENAVPEQRQFHTPAETRAKLRNFGKENNVAFSTRNICHLGHEHLHTISLEIMDILGVNVITGAGVPGNFLPDVVFDTYQHLMASYYPSDRIILNNLRLPPLFAGPREAFLQAIMLQNHGYNFFIVGRDHAGSGGYYDKYAAQEIFTRLTDPSIEILRVSEQRYCTICRKITTERSCRHNDEEVKKYNGRDVRRLLAEKEYNELSHFLRPDLQDIVIDLLQAKVMLDEDATPVLDERKLFY